MRKCLTTIVSFSASLVTVVQVQAIVPDAAVNRFASIPERNLFGLRPPPPAAPVTTPSPTLPKLLLTGITTILGNKRALMKTQPPAGSPPGTKEQSLILTEGQREGPIEVLEINEHAGSVKVDNSGTVTTLTFEKDGPKLPATPAPPAAAGMPPGLPTSTAPASGFGAPVTNPPPAPGTTPGAFTLPTRTPRGMPAAGTAGNLPNSGTTPAVSPWQAPTGRGPVPAVSLPPLPGQNPADNLTPEEQAIIEQLRNETQAHSSMALPQTAPAPGTPQAGVSTVVPPGFKTPATVPPGGSPGPQLR